MKKYAFTLPEVLITVAIIGVVAVLTISSTVTNIQQSEFKTGLKKAVNVINSAITMNMTNEGISPYESQDLYAYLQNSLNVMESSKSLKYYVASSDGKLENAVLYTLDGMRFEFSKGGDSSSYKKLHESDTTVCEANHPDAGDANCRGCGSLGLSNNINATTKPPCLILVDVNGDRKPTPNNASCQSEACANQNKYKYILPNAKNVNDIFSIMITDEKAVPFGVAAQRVMYNAQK